MTLNTLKEKVLNFTPSRPHDIFAIEAIKEALEAAEKGSFGVGAILMDEKSGEIICRGQNEVFTKHRSDFHAEMTLLNRFEAQHGSKSRELLKKLVLFTSLESCPMCLCRIITSGVSKVYHIADDDRGGMVQRHSSLPPTWQEISSNRLYVKSDCSAELSEYAMQVFLLTVDLDKHLV